MKLPNLNLPLYELEIKNKEDKPYIFDIVRKKQVRLTPEEWVRQNFIHYLIEQLGYSKALIKVESGLHYNQRIKRSDIVVFNNQALPELLVECKATTIPINQDMFDQAAVYNQTIKAPYLIITNGLDHYCCQVDFENNKISFLETIPSKK